MGEEIKRLELGLELKPYLKGRGAKEVSKRLNVREEVVRNYRALQKRTGANVEEKGYRPRILLLDIETSPMMAYVWKRFKENISLDQTIQEWYMLCWSAKWLDEPEIMSGCLTPKEAQDGDDKRILKPLWDLLNDCDFVIAHNGKGFDIPKINSRFIVNGFNPPAPYKQIDTLDVSKKVFGFSSNKLDHLATQFGIENKDKVDFSLWKDCMNGDQKALFKMVTYNKKDVSILELVYLKLRPWIPHHPNFGLYTENNVTVCPACGSNHLHEDLKDFAYTNASRFTLYRCDTCGAFARGRFNNLPIKKRNSLLLSV